MTRLIGTVKGLEIDGWNENKTGWDEAIDSKLLFTEYERIVKNTGAVLIFSQEPYTSHIRNNLIYNLKFAQSAIWLKNHFANGFGCKNSLVSYFEDISIYRKRWFYDCTELREYFDKVRAFIGLPLAEIKKTIGANRVDHTFRTNTLQFVLCIESTYNAMIAEYGIDRMEGFLPYSELRLMKGKRQQTFNLPENEKFVSNVFEFPKERKRYHPTQKPVLLLERLINIYSNKGDTVLDNCMGSGSTGVAAMNTGRNFIGIEKEENYFKIAQERIAEAQSFQLING